jgi:hypothetical protein
MSCPELQVNARERAGFLGGGTNSTRMSAFRTQARGVRWLSEGHLSDPDPSQSQNSQPRKKGRAYPPRRDMAT